MIYIPERHRTDGLCKSNILVDDNRHARLADFGLSCLGHTTQRDSVGVVGESCRWAAPELIAPVDRFNIKSHATDIYSFACACLEVPQLSSTHGPSDSNSHNQLYTGKRPFDGVLKAAVLSWVIQGYRPSRPTQDDCAMSDGLWDIIQRCWEQAPSGRPTAAAVLELMRPLVA